MPAIAALISIGPKASKALIRSWPPVSEKDRLPFILVVSRIGGVAEARWFLANVMDRNNLERSYLNEGLRRMSGIH